MKINKILAPLLLLSLVNGLYNPIEAMITSDNPVLTMHIYYNLDANKWDHNKHKEVVLVDKGDTTKTNEKRAKIIDDLITHITTAIDDADDFYMRFWMELSKDHIKEEYKDSLVYWFKIFSDDKLRPFTELFIQVDNDNEVALKKEALNKLIADQGKGVLFFQKESSSDIDEEEEIFTQNFTNLAKNKNLEDIDDINALRGHEPKIAAHLRAEKQALQKQIEEEAAAKAQLDALAREQEKGGHDVGSWKSLVTERYQALMGTIARYKIAFGIILTVIVSLAMAIYHKRDALAAFAHRLLNRKGL